ncbi:fatty aldehyde dehydrogenase Hfd1p [Diutina catenulata]
MPPKGKTSKAAAPAPANATPAAAVTSGATANSGETTKISSVTDTPVYEKKAPSAPAAKPAAKQSAPAPTSAGPLKFTKVDEIAPNVQRLADAFHKTQKTHSVQFRLNQLRNVYFAIKDNVDAICDALEKDFCRARAETQNLEVLTGLNELVFVMANLHKWSTPEKVTDLPLNLRTNPVYVERIPLGVVLVITPFNYPFLLSLSSIIGALAGGNCVVWKPSELTPHFSQLFTEILTKALDKDTFYVVNGGIPETTAVLDQRYDKIMYTGNNMVGKIIASKAAETLTPVLLELGGKSPAFVIEDVKDKDIQTIANRIVWGRFTNAGQTCVAVDYVVVHKSIKAKLVDAMVTAAKEKFYPGLNKDSKDYTHIIHDRAFNNLNKLIKETKGKVVLGGESDAESRYIPPTIVTDVDWNDSTMSQELFGPVLPVIEYDNLEDTLHHIVGGPHDTPLAQYIFTSGATNRKKNPDVDSILTFVRSGAVIVNDCLLHVALVNAPFGGVGNSGIGAYHGFHSYKAFTHERTTIEQKLWNEFMLKVRYPPFNAKNNAVIDAVQTDHAGKVWFGRTGDVRVGGPSTFFNVWTGVAGVAALVYAFAGAM